MCPLIQGVKFHYVEAGDVGKPLLLLLHGFPDCWLSWREQIPALAEYYRYVIFNIIINRFFNVINIIVIIHRVVAIDLKGFGDSDKPSKKRYYKIEIIIDELKQFISTFDAKTCSIIGHDLGGLLGWYMVALHGDIICKFIAISSPHPNLYWNKISKNAVFDEK